MIFCLQGELIIREQSLFVLPAQGANMPRVSTSPIALIIQHLKQLSPHQYPRFYNLSYVHFPANLDPKIHLPELALAIFETNAVSAGPGEVGIFPRMARLNHGCSSAFNVVENEGVLVVHTLKDIKKGQVGVLNSFDLRSEMHSKQTYLDHQSSVIERASLPWGDPLLNQARNDCQERIGHNSE
ncbi:hypothetical protein BDP27DRAFT_1344309 [Rhodocollybia butyracea]|uniref:SET domain-containing protein n=1 Tax=Rhodocollybia butyracea TaxID=206335 RepID=A0A9P5TWZ4_9AGAR|nr:hypothetical protein BDP27DRAFT_1344309 [Rhodocollybia butyracea]